MSRLEAIASFIFDVPACAYVLSGLDLGIHISNLYHFSFIVDFATIEKALGKCRIFIGLHSYSLGSWGLKRIDWGRQISVWDYKISTIIHISSFLTLDFCCIRWICRNGFNVAYKNNVMKTSNVMISWLTSFLCEISSFFLCRKIQIIYSLYMCKFLVNLCINNWHIPRNSFTSKLKKYIDA